MTTYGLLSVLFFPVVLLVLGMVIALVMDILPNSLIRDKEENEENEPSSVG